VNAVSKYWNRINESLLEYFLNNERTLLSLCVNLKSKLKQCGHVNITIIL